MSRRAVGAGPARVGRWFAVTLAAVAALAGTAASAGVQVEAVVARRELEYLEAKTAYDAAVAALQAAQARAEGASLEFEEARRAGDDGRLQRALAEAQARWTQVATQDRRVADTRERLRRARLALRDALEQSLDRLAEQARTAASAEERGALLALWRDRDNRLREVEAELTLPSAEVTRFVAMPEITFDPRDGPVELRAKAALLFRRAAQMDSIIVWIEGEIAKLEKRERRDRALRNFMSSIERFDEGAVPLGRPAQDAAQRADRDAASPAGGAPGDTAAAVALSLPEQIAQLRALKSRLEQLRESARARGELFRRRAEGVRG